MKLTITHILALIFIFQSCSIKKLSIQNLIGEYKHDVIYGVYSHLTLKEDSTFIFKWQQGLEWGKTKGRWHHEKNSIFLNSEKQLKAVKENYYIQDTLLTSNNNNDKLWVKLTDVDGFPLPFANSYLLKRKKDTILNELADINGIFTFSIEKIRNAKNLHFNYIGFADINIPVKRIKTNSIIVKMKYGVEPYVYFEMVE